MKGPDTLAAYRPAVLTGLEGFIKGRLLDSGLPWKTDTLERLRDFAAGGKLMRGCLVCHSYVLCSGSSGRQGLELPATVLNAAVAIELFQCGLLVHDDIMDQDELRRGKPAMHKQYERLAVRGKVAQAPRVGESLALGAGDMVLFLAFETLAATEDKNLVELFARELGAVCAGQMQDVYLGASPEPPSKRAIYEIMRTKTATYSLALPLVAGAVLAGQGPVIRRRLYEIGLAAGVIFQIRDDELGVFGQTASIGKPIGSDIHEGKKTLLYYYLWRAASTIERERLATIFGNPQAASADIDYVRQAMRRHKIPAHLREDIAKLERTAFGGIDKLRLDQTAKAGLRRVVKFCASRQA